MKRNLIKKCGILCMTVFLTFLIIGCAKESTLPQQEKTDINKRFSDGPNLEESKNKGQGTLRQ